MALVSAHPFLLFQGYVSWEGAVFCGGTDKTLCPGSLQRVAEPRLELQNMVLTFLTFCQLNNYGFLCPVDKVGPGQLWFQPIVKGRI